ncbi:hypothetical protein ON010_g7179 [Phytophthora cinnamomi]|nr:hypothetical protein ON010_g7179 [Phytophthora cinnamomi]
MLLSCSVTRKNVNNLRPAKHFAFYEELMEQLLAVDSPEAFASIEEAANARERTAPSPSRNDVIQHAEGDPLVDGDHRLEENPDTAEGEQGTKRRQRLCKVCALFKVQPRKFTKYFCPELKYLCNVGREGRDTCFRIWHIEWKNGNAIPPMLLDAHKTLERPPPSRPGKKRRHRAQESGGGGGGGGGGGDTNANDDSEGVAEEDE